MPDGAPLIDPDIVAGRIAALLQDRRPGAVKPLLAALEKLAPDHQDLVALRVACCCQTGDFEQALQLLGEAIARQPNPILYLRRAEIRFGQADYAAAAADAAAAILAAPELARAKSVLGLALLQLGQFDAALPCLAEGFAADPAGVDVALALAALAPERAIEVLNQAVAATPKVAVLRNALTRRHLCSGDLANALHNAGRSRADGLADAETYCLQAFAQVQGCAWAEAAASVAQAQRLVPGHRWAARLAAALAQREAGELRPELHREFHRELHQDGAAAEQAMLSGGTILPGTFRSLLQDVPRSGPVLDLFCGTGLNAIAAQDICSGPWTGIDPDPSLLALAAARGQYARLERSGPLGFLEQGGQYPVILLNEALAYTASPGSWLGALRAGLAEGGIALAAIPEGRSGLTGHGLFAHDLSRLAPLAAQARLGCRLLRSGILRRIEGLPLHGVIAVFHPL